MESPIEPEEPQRNEYGVPMSDVRIYVDRAVRELGLDPSLVNDMDRAGYAWRLSHHSQNIAVAQRILGMPNASLSELAQTMADAGKEVRRQIEHDPEYHYPPDDPPSRLHW